MIVQEKSFDGYIGVIAEFDSSNRQMQWNGLSYLVPATFYWCPVRKDKGRMHPRWDDKRLIRNFRCGFLVPVEYAGSSASIEMFIREECSTLLDEVESHFCRIGECKINASRCPERKVS